MEHEHAQASLATANLERDRDDFNDKHGGDDDPMPGDVFGTLYYEKVVFIQNLRVRINYAIDVILDPVNAVVTPAVLEGNGWSGSLDEIVIYHFLNGESRPCQRGCTKRR